MRLTDDEIIKALEQGKLIKREELDETICFYRSKCGALVMRQPGSKNEVIASFIVADLKADDWEVVDE